MSSLNEIESSLLSDSSGNYPPVQKWNPPFSGEIEITIRANGDWYHEGIKFTRQALVKLFSSILKKEGDNYFLVTPVEKWKISVEDAPLLVIEMDIMENSIDVHQQIIRFKTATGDVVPLNSFHPLLVVTKNNSTESRPYVLIRDGLEALINRNVFYRLANMAENIDGAFGVWSAGIFFKLQ
jgi:hypothetical protein